MSAPTKYAVWSAAGASVAIGARRSDITAESVAEIKAVCPPPAATGQQVIGVSLDVTDAASIEAAYAEVGSTQALTCWVFNLHFNLHFIY